ncbi:MAG: sigma-70 family RNA polymerase sigma factor [Actinomycetota bacterium]
MGSGRASGRESMSGDGSAPAGGLLDQLRSGSPVAESRILTHYRNAGDAERTALLDRLAAQAADDCPYALAVVLAVIDEHALTTGALHATGVDHATRPDVDQAVLIAVARSIHRFRGESKFTTWLYALTRNVAVSELRRHKPTVDLSGVGAEEAIRRSGLDPRRLSSLVTEAQAIETVIGQLPEPFQQTVRLRDVEQLSYRQIAERQGLSINTVKSRLSRGREMLAELLSADER